MSQTIDSLLLDLLEWINQQERTYNEVMSAWRTSCPKLPVWEEAIDRGLVQRENKNELGEIVAITSAGRKFLEQRSETSKS
jgi:D-3-phosphoglycerate dehydrogenase